MVEMLFECYTCQHYPRPRFPDEKTAIAHMLIVHDWILGPDGPEPPKEPRRAKS